MASQVGVCSNKISDIIGSGDSEDEFEASFDFQCPSYTPAPAEPSADGTVAISRGGDLFRGPQNLISASDGSQHELTLSSNLSNNKPTLPDDITNIGPVSTDSDVVVPEIQPPSSSLNGIRDEKLDTLVLPRIKEEWDARWKFADMEHIDLTDSVMPTPEQEREQTEKIPRTGLIHRSSSENDIMFQAQVSASSPVGEGNKEDCFQAATRYHNREVVQEHRREADQHGNQESLDPSRASDPLPTQTHLHKNNQFNTRNNDLTRMHQFQKMLAERALGKPLAEDADVLFNKLQPSHSLAAGTDERDPNTWMNATVDSDTDPGSTFAAAKSEFRKKYRAGKANWIDEIIFKKAKNAEKARLKRLELDHLATREITPSKGIDEESDADLFVNQVANTSQKRPYHMTTQVIEDERSEGETEHSRARTKRAKPASKGKHAKDVAMELEASFLVGMEADLTTRENKNFKKMVRTRRLKGQTTQKKHLNASKGKTRKRNPSKTKKAGPLHHGMVDNVASLLHSNVFEEANDNLGSHELPTVTHKDKHKALTELLASVPLEEKESARGERSQILQSIRSLGSRKVFADGAGMWHMKGIITSLHHHQIQGIARMHERETGTIQPLGGLQADQMGFGKTLMTIATIIANPPGPEDSKCTLIVCTPALLTQWMDELASHVETGFLPQVVRYQASTGKITFGKKCEYTLSNANVVLTTYQEVLRSYPKYNPPKNLVTDEEKKSWWKTVHEGKRDLLHQIHFFRVVLDEAQAIKNCKSQTSIACRALMAKHRWALSGTPIQNNVEELFPYFKFLRVKHTGNFQVFKENFCSSDNEDSTTRLHSFLKQFMIRRTHKDKLFGAPIVPMPSNTQVTHVIEFNAVERAIYEAVKLNYIEKINTTSRAGTLEKSYQNVLTMLLRLRQLTAHPFTLQGIIENFFELEDVQKLRKVCASKDDADQKPARNMLTTMEKMIKAHKNPGEISQTITVEPLDPNSQEEDEEEASPLVSKFRKFLTELANNSKWAELEDRTLCHRCKDQPEDPWVTDCEHVYCQECLRSLAFKAAANGATQSACLECGHIFATSYPCKGIEELELRKESISSTTAVSRCKQKHPDEDLKWINIEGNLLPSSKTAAVQKQIQQWLNEDATKKIIVFSQFYTVMKVLERMCEHQKWGHCKYDGNMNIIARDKVIENFRTQPDLKVMIASLKCGGVGLNLTMASRVICVDLWWNDSVEQQAFCRVFRMGQVSETFLARFVIKDTVDEKLLDMQKDKATKIGVAVDNSKMLEKLTMHELLRLFGPVKLDENHKPFILVDDDKEFQSLLPRSRKDTEGGGLRSRPALTASEDTS